MKLEAKVDSWQWLFDTTHNNMNEIARADGQSNGNFWAILQHLEQQFQDGTMKCAVEGCKNRVEKPGDGCAFVPICVEHARNMTRGGAPR